MVIIGGIRGRLIGPVGEWRRLRKKGNEALASCVAYAEERGVTLLLEPINRYETNVMNTVEEGIALIAELGSEKVKLLLDTFHMNIEERSVAESIIMAGSRLEYVHFSDSNRLAPGWGHVDFSEILSILKEIHYNGPIGVEVLPSPDDDRASKQALDYIRALV
jgi:sugar phosphate isomerase/epimerase